MSRVIRDTFQAKQNRAKGEKRIWGRRVTFARRVCRQGQSLPSGSPGLHGLRGRRTQTQAPAVLTPFPSTCSETDEKLLANMTEDGKKLLAVADSVFTKVTGDLLTGAVLVGQLELVTKHSSQFLDIWQLSEYWERHPPSRSRARSAWVRPCILRRGRPLTTTSVSPRR